MLGNIAFDKLLHYSFKTVLDIGAGKGECTKLFRDAGKTVTPIDIRVEYDGFCGDYMKVGVQKHDCAWCCHVLEHQTNINAFLKKMSNDVVDGGIIAITVPPRKEEIVGGHLSFWNAGLLIYNLVMAEIDCSKAQIRGYAYNISVIVRNNTFEMPSNIYSDVNELEVLRDYLPSCVKDSQTGKIDNYNWNIKI